MSSRDPRVDAYIARSAEFAQPILGYLRELVHAACPEVEETIKWGSPHFTRNGKLFCYMAAFKQHAAFGFWRGAAVVGVAPGASKSEGMGQFGRLASIADLPSRRNLQGLLRKARVLGEGGIEQPARKRNQRGVPSIPVEFATAIATNERAQRTFDGFPPGEQREYVDWIVSAKHAETRARRVAQAIEWLSEGKRRDWKYMAGREACA